MNENELSLPNAGNDIKPVEFFYLDRDRLLSYASQLHDGLTVLRRMLDASSEGGLDQPIGRSRQETKGSVTSGEAGVQAGVKIQGGRQETHNVSSGITSGGRFDADWLTQALTEDKVEHDNQFLLVEKELEERGLLHDFEGALEQSGLYRFTGSLTFFDWNIITQFFAHWKDIQAFADDKKFDVGLKNSQIQAIPKMLKTFSLTDISAYVTCQQKSISASLDPSKLTMTVEQLRTTYLTDKAIDATLIAYAASESEQPHRRAGIAAHVKFGAIFNAFIGKVDHSVYPVAIYSRL